MVIHRSNISASGPATAEECFAAMQRHHERGTAGRLPGRTAGPHTMATGGQGGDGGGSGHRVGPAPADPGDIIYGAKAIARFLFGEDGDRARRRVFNLWAHYRERKERAGFFKLKGALCLSKSQWRGFHGL